MAALEYHSVECDTKKDNYQEYDNLDFNINVGEGRSLIKNSVRLVANIAIRDNAGANTGGIYLDHRAGAHAVIDSVQVAFTGGGMDNLIGTKENIQNYARLVVAHGVATKSPEDYLNASEVCELKGYDWKSSNLIAKGKATRGTTPVASAMDFSIKPFCMLNKMSGGDLPFMKSGNIRLSINLATNRSALMGYLYNQAQDDYVITNPRVTFNSVATPKNPTQSIFRSVYNVKNSILSNFASVNAKVPAVVDGCSIVFQQQVREQTAPYSNMDCEFPRGLEKVQFLFNDAVNYITYSIDDQTEMLQRFIDSFNDSGHNQVGGSRFGDNQSFGIGINFASAIDLSNQKFNFQITSKADNANSYNAYLYFHSVTAI